MNKVQFVSKLNKAPKMAIKLHFILYPYAKISLPIIKELIAKVVLFFQALNRSHLCNQDRNIHKNNIS